MLKGFNTDLRLQGAHYHVQTEDWGFQNPWIVSRVFRNGAVVDSQRTPYSEVLRAKNAFLLMRDRAALAEVLRQAMQDQHQSIVDKLSQQSPTPN
ncbi:MAG TPA: hypothetical protein PLZ57_12575 [Pseudobdellovibrionaceae bacterium]|nr:hypothetical protein [Pseudobdellovibrionaceae bacterium]